MEYLRPYSLGADETIVAAWESQVALASDIPALTESLAQRAPELFARFADAYARIGALSRGSRRALQRHLTESPAFSDVPQKRRQKLARSLAGAALLIALAQGVEAATITVTTNKPNIKDGDGKCSLIEAIINANDSAATHADCAAGDAGSNTIVLPNKSTQILSAINNYDFFYTPMGLPLITSTMTIVGNGSKIMRLGGKRFGLLTVVAPGNLTLQNAIVSGAQYFGGVFNRQGILTIENCTIQGNKSGKLGGGVTNVGGILSIKNSDVSNNTAVEGGGGIFNQDGTATIENSTISHNRAGAGAGIYNFFTNDSIVTIKNSVISDNEAHGGYYGSYGGGIRNSNTMSIENSTISGNSTVGSGGGMSNTYRVSVENSTISANRAKYGGGIYNENGRDSLLIRSLISGNKALGGSEVHGYSQADNHNVFGNNGVSGVTGFTPGLTDIVPSGPLNKIIGPLKNNGGPTRTHALVAGSPAIDAIPSSDPSCVGTDQRGVARPNGLGCDIGAFER